MDLFLRITSVTAIVFGLFLGLLTLDYYKRNDLILPRTTVGDLTLGGLSKARARILLKDRWNKFLETPITLVARGEVQTFTLNELGVLFDESALIDSIPTGETGSNTELIVNGFFGKRYLPTAGVSRTQLQELIYKKFPTIPPSRNAYVQSVKGKFALVEAKSGLKPDVEILAQQLEKNVAFFETTPLIVNFSERLPTIQPQDLEPHLEQLKTILPKTITFNFEKQKWTVNFREHLDWLRFERPEAVDTALITTRTPLPDFPFVIYWDTASFNQFIDEKLASLDQKPEDVRIWKEGDKIKIEGQGNDGRVVDRDEFHDRITQALNTNTVDLEIPMRTVVAKTDISPEVQEMGIRELVAVGYTRYDGSPANRQHNVATGVNTYNGLIIPADAIFSFNENLGPVDGEHGYKPELVIKAEGTIPEFGGGLCQVSTTLYRAALNGGLPIVDRAPHSYAVSYYSQVGGHGLDATIYPPNRDFKFKNDTPGPLLIQLSTQGTSAYFKLYGTKDDRTVALDGPFISNQHSAPAAALEVPDPKLKPGQRKQVEKAHGGFDVLWYRNITKNGDTIKEEIKSRYKATQAKFLVGGPVVPVDPAKLDANPFE